MINRGCSHASQIENSPRHRHRRKLALRRQLTISTDSAELVGLLHYEKILVANLRNRERFEAYVI